MDVAVADIPDRIIGKVEITDSCWLWHGAISDTGYGNVWAPGTVIAHRYFYERSVGPIPEGLHLDHLCAVRTCVNPDHLEPVTQQENMRRAIPPSTHCRRGHERTPENTSSHHGKPRCLVCHRENERLRRQRDPEHLRALGRASYYRNRYRIIP